MCGCSGAQAMASNGMKAVGWSYINLDDCWTGPNRTAAGNIMADPCVLQPPAFLHLAVRCCQQLCVE